MSFEVKKGKVVFEKDGVFFAMTSEQLDEMIVLAPKAKEALQEQEIFS